MLLVFKDRGWGLGLSGLYCLELQFIIKVYQEFFVGEYRSWVFDQYRGGLQNNFLEFGQSLEVKKRDKRGGW